MPRSLAYEPRHALNAICPYFTMFPLEYPLRVIAKHRRDRPVVMDPFCGRGTTLFAARALGLVSRGVDSSPVAVAIAQAKLSFASTDEVLELARSYIHAGFKSDIPASPFFASAYDPGVLRDICAIRHGLLTERSESDVVVLLRAAMLGCLHGPMSKRPDTQSYFSNQMPRTFASKPDYSVRYWNERGLIAPATNVLQVLRRKLERIQFELPPVGATFSNARLGDSRYAKSLPQNARDFSLVVTSPPYYGMVTYVQDQWLRNWFLGGPDYVDYANPDQLSHAGKNAFCESLGAVWKNMARTREQDLHMYVRFGIIPSAKADPKSLMKASLESSGIRWRLISTRAAATAASGKRQANHMAAGSTAAIEYDFHICRI